METLLHIDNEPVSATDGATFERVAPHTGQTVTRGAAAGIRDSLAAVDAASRAFVEWSRSGPGQRRALLLKAADEIEARMGDFVAAMQAEVGANALWSQFNVMLAANLFREAAGLATQIQGETIPTDKPGTLSMTLRQPCGVVLSIVPWNGPVVLAARAIAYPLVCGNTVVFRASETSPRTHELIAQAVYAAGFPAGTLNFITHDLSTAPEAIEALIAHPAVRRVNFTGSTAVGRIIGEKAGKHLKRCILELGDKSPLVVLDDARVDDAVTAGIFGAFLYQGQICMTTERIIVDEKIADDYVAKFAARARELPLGDPTTQAACVLGPVISMKAADRLKGLLDDAVAKGARIVAGGHGEGAMMPATVLDGVTPEMRIYAEETFGPIVSIIRAKGTEDAIRIANDTEFGLSAGVFGQDVTRALEVAARLETGSVHINGATVQNEAQAPYGGTKASGFGRFDGRAVIDEFTELKWLTIEQSGQGYPF
ncbi:aldehyde dehydrogenase [Paracoccus denitrificans]|jgi:acyl-CoA reductase-like NAD-dependent aldehyde dehydrogenase|uniref:Aldehyde dehydrogenase n=1 Tax=Paracoccus denitrificans (strain Pd 1222) TaxID=318586 RepID=A1AYF2_PARDP|nr:aldehyde dehydrogenase [Paracoccus denitrificans]ABL68296.1 aldehyde dehydrogenase [Paracoccus denitrificans PD1222]MBB4627810.1 acyl-CoA reductase-like NAD-dependent aldehyde dehydrogenase [Paracoccus denitrificans]MCU7428654.1 aldehyde dehydrogenase [Paracoccus denitrificans]QAR26386.1 aldehyde dehydrogenase [Paracoccus denitrificans]UPV95314.1 aldehyde dehydrogenase [Paracoccus denitrificans]